MIKKIALTDIALIGGSLFIAVITLESIIYQLGGGQLHGCIIL